MPLTCSLSQPVLSIDLSLNVDDVHTFSITGRGASLPNLGEVSIEANGTTVLIGTITNATLNSDGTFTVSGQDRSSYAADHADVEDVIKDAFTLTSISSCMDSVCTGTNFSHSSPSQSCYGFGSYSGTVKAFIERICNSFGFHYVYNATGNPGVVISADVIEPGQTGVNVPTMDFTNGYSLENSISKVYLQKSVEATEGQDVDVKNGARQWNYSSPVFNSVSTAQGSQYPQTVFIDPGSMQLVTIYSNSVFVDFDQAVDIDNAVYIVINEWSDTTSNPRWELYLYENDTFLYKFNGIGEFHSWTAPSGHVCNKAVIARENPTTHVIEYPGYDGLTCNITVYQSNPSASVSGWEQSYQSGDGGREDKNIIDEPMYPPLSQMSQLGVRIAKHDSNPHTNTIILPEIQSIPLALPETTYVNIQQATSEFPKVQVPLVQVDLQESAGNQQTTITGEY